MTLPSTIHSSKEPGSYTAVLDILRDLLLTRTRDWDPSLFQLHGFWDVSLLFQPSQVERLFTYTVYLAQTSREGCCYTFADPARIRFDVLGSDARTSRTGNLAVDIAILDSAYAVLPPRPAFHRIITGSSAQKAIERARLIADEVDRYLTTSPRRRVAVVGAIGILIRELLERKCDVLTTDLDVGLIGTDLDGVLVRDGTRWTMNDVEDADVAIITGMTLATNTLEPILKAAKGGHTRTIIIAETGAALAQMYIPLFGADCVISEPFPFYVFSGPSEINIYRGPA